MPSSHAPGRTYLVAHPGAELFGSDRMMLESVRGMRDTGARVVVALPETGPLVSELAASGAEVVIVPMLVLRKALLRPRAWGILLRDSLRGAAAIWRLLSRQRPDAVYVSTITIPQWPLVSALRGVPVVSHVHEAEASASRVVNVALYLPHLCARSVLVNSQFSLRTISESLPALAARCQVVHNGVAGPIEPTAPRELIDELRVLYIGRLSPRKGVDDLISAVQLLQDHGVSVHVSLLGSVFPGYEWYEQQLRDLVAEDDGVDVTFLGFRPDVWPVLAEHDVLVVPSRVDEPFGNTAVEGILAHRPVIATDTSGLREAAGGYTTAQLVPPSDPASLARALKRVIEDWEAIGLHVRGSAELATQRHSQTVYQEKVANAVTESTRPSVHH